jgi:hypothetical protein
VEPEEASIAKQQLGKPSFRGNEYTSNNRGICGNNVYVRSLQSGNNRRELVNWDSVGSRAVKRRLYVCCSTVIFEVFYSVRLL